MANAFHFFSRLITIATEYYFLLLFHYYLLYLPVVAAADVKIVPPSIINLKYEKKRACKKKRTLLSDALNGKCVSTVAGFNVSGFLDKNKQLKFSHQSHLRHSDAYNQSENCFHKVIAATTAAHISLSGLIYSILTLSLRKNLINCLFIKARVPCTDYGIRPSKTT